MKVIIYRDKETKRIVRDAGDDYELLKARGKTDEDIAALVEEFNGRENCPQTVEIVELDEVAEFYRTQKQNRRGKESLQGGAGMILIDREMKAVEYITAKSNYSLKCQASFNSDGVLTLRNYNVENKNSDEIIILSREETEAIVELFRAIKQLGVPNIPF